MTREAEERLLGVRKTELITEQNAPAAAPAAAPQ